MFDRFPDEPRQARPDGKNRCPGCDRVVSADHVKCPHCHTVNPKNAEVYHRRKVIRQNREKRIAEADRIRVSRLTPKGPK